MIKKKYNKSVIFLLPMLGININKFDKFYNVYYKSIYNNDENKKRIYIVYENKFINNTIINEISNIPYYLDNYNLDSFIIFRFKVPELYISDFILFCNGCYSRFSSNYKQLLLTSYSINKTELNKILNPLDKDRKELANKFDVNQVDIVEIYPILDEIEETFSISNSYKLEI